MKVDVLQQLLPSVVEIAEHAAADILTIYHSGEMLNVAKKADQTPLTQADLAAHNRIESGLQALTPDIPILSEESDFIPYDVRRHWARYWLVDPLDGTREFIKRNDEFSVNIALIVDQQPVLGVILAPVTGDCYTALRGVGAYKSNANSRPVSINVRTCPDQQVTVAGSRSHRDYPLNDFLQQLNDYCLVSLGSSLKSCLVAEGGADIYPRIGPTSEWDTAAAQIIVEEAGGFLADLSGLPLRYNTKDSLLNPSFLVYGDDTIDWKKYFVAACGQQP